MARKYAKRKRKRSTRRRRRRPKVVLSVNSNIGIPKLQKVRFCQRYTETVDLGTGGLLQFRANGPGDPTVAVTSDTQPIRWNEMKPFWGKYVVHSSKITAHVMGLSAINQQVHPIFFGCHLSNSTNPIPGTLEFTNVISQGRTSYKTVNLGNVSYPVKCAKSFSAKQFFNVKDVKDVWDDYGARMDQTPVEQAFFNVFWQFLDPTFNPVDPVEVNILVTIDYVVEFGEPRSLNPSAQV